MFPVYPDLYPNLPGFCSSPQLEDKSEQTQDLVIV